jgi:hypothetical protein
MMVYLLSLLGLVWQWRVAFIWSGLMWFGLYLVLVD